MFYRNTKKITERYGDSIPMEVASVIQAIDHTYQKIKVAEEKWIAKKKKWSITIARVQATCTHPVYTYFPDASGGNDSYERCEICGKEDRCL